MEYSFFSNNVVLLFCEKQVKYETIFLVLRYIKNLVKSEDFKYESKN